jgi:hypothetical protein
MSDVMLKYWQGVSHVVPGKLSAMKAPAVATIAGCVS